MKYKYYFFDFDYTLVNSEKGIVGCFVNTMKDFGIEPPVYEYIRSTIGMPIEAEVEKLTGLTGEQNEAFINRYKKYADEIMTANTHFFPDTLPALRRIKEAGSKVAIVSTKTRHRIMEKFQLDKVTELVDVVIGREDITLCKPNPQGIFIAMEKLGAKAEEILYLGDSLYDAGAAKNAKVDFAAVLTGTTTKEEFADYPAVKIMQNLSELE